MSDPVAGPVLLYDGLCGFCDRAVQFVLARDPGGPMRFAPLQGAYARAVVARHPALAGVDSLILVESSAAGVERVAVRSEGALRVAHYLGGGWRIAALLRIVPRAARDWAYDLFARHRYRVWGRHAACPLPAAGQRARFILDGDIAARDAVTRV